MLDPFGIRLGRFERHADRQQQIDHHAMPGAHPGRQAFARFGQEHAAIRLGDRQTLPLQPPDGLDRCRMRHAQAAGYVGRPSLPAIGQKVGNQLDIILQQRARLGGARLAEAAGLSRLFRQRRGRTNRGFHHRVGHDQVSSASGSP